MESVLNLVWSLLGVTLVWLGLRCAPRKGTGRWRQISVLAVLLVILFPVISVTDDIQAAQLTAETETGQRKDQAVSPHTELPTVVAPLLPSFYDFAMGEAYFLVQAERSLARPSLPALAAVENRPPPATV